MVRMGSVEFNFDFALDPLSSVMILIITGVGTLIHVYAAAYMATEKAYWRFFTYLNLFVFSMLLLVLGDGFIVMFFGWEGVGLCSYLLIGFWYEDYNKASAGMKAFVTNRIGDWGFVTGLLLLFWGSGSWLQGGYYQPDNLARLALVSPEAGEAGEPEGSAASKRGDAEHGKPAGHAGEKAYLTFTAFPGAEVYLDGGSTPFAVSPFVKREVRPGHHGLRIIPGGGIDDQEIPAAATEAGTESVISVVGPTFVFRQLHDQLVIRDTRGQTTLRDALTSKTVWGGISLVTLACICFFIGATAKRPDPALRLAARRDGRSHSRERAHPRGHHGHRWCLHVARMSWLFS